MSRVLPYTPFLGIAAYAIYQIWPVNISRNNFLNEAEAAKTEPEYRLADGSSVVREYTGNPGLDGFLITMVAFFYDLLEGTYSEAYTLLTRYLLGWIQVLPMLQVAEAYRGGASVGICVAYPVITGMLSQLVGMGIVWPIYCFFHLWSTAGKKLSPIPASAAAAMLPAYIFGCFLPTLAITALSPLSSVDTLTKQQLMTIWQPFPAFICTIQFVVSNTLTRPCGTKPGVRSINALYGTTFALAAASHLFCAYSAFTTKGSVRELLEVAFLPESEPANVGGVVRGAAWFLKWDNITIGASALLWAWVLMVREGMNVVGAAVRLGVATVVMGPGAAVATALWWREGEILKKSAVAGRKKKV